MGSYELVTLALTERRFRPVCPGIYINFGIKVCFQENYWLFHYLEKQKCGSLKSSLSYTRCIEWISKQSPKSPNIEQQTWINNDLWEIVSSEWGAFEKWACMNVRQLVWFRETEEAHINTTQCLLWLQPGQITHTQNGEARTKVNKCIILTVCVGSRRFKVMIKSERI